MSPFAIFLLAGVSLAEASAVKTIEELHAGPMRYRKLVGAVDKDWVKAKAIAELGPRNITFGRLVVYGSRGAARSIERESYSSCSWKALRTALEANGVIIQPSHCPEVSEAIKIGSSIVLRTVDSSCRSTRSVIQGTSDPLRIRSMGAEHEILAVSLRRRHGKDPSVGTEQVIVSIFVRAGSKPSIRLARDILARFKALSKAEEMMVFVKDNAELFTHCASPAPYLFDGPDSIAAALREPTGAGTEATCSMFDPFPVQCWVSSGTR